MPAKITSGLTSAEAAQRLADVGPNTLGEVRATPWPVILLRQFTGLLVVILIVAAGIAAALGEVIDAIAIGLVVALNGVLGFIQEWRAETALEALRSMLAQHARVLRDGVERRIDTREIVPGDVVRLSAGDKVPADLALTGSVELRVEESALTGESLPVSKAHTDPEAKLFMGTSVVGGHAEGAVTATGRATAFGEIAELTTSVGEKKTHLQEVLEVLARQLAIGSVALAALILAAGLYTGHGLHEMFLMALSLAVAIVPEGLPAVVTITLALGAAAMVRKQALARRLQAVETLGAASVICTDKTGTLTEDKMTATRIALPGGSYRVTGGGYDPAGHIENPDGTPVRVPDDPDLAALLETVLACNRAHLERDDGETWRMVGTPTEGALVTLAYKGWCPLPANEPVAELPFSSERKRMSVLSAGEGGDVGTWVLHVKGAPERILERCTRYRQGGTDHALERDDRARFTTAWEALASEGARVIAVARRACDGPTRPPTKTR
ncbi:MAG: HAD-IC family P-type ATPase [Paracoccaceae bacterium]